MTKKTAAVGRRLCRHYRSGRSFRVDFCRAWIAMCEGANTCLMPGGDGLPESAMFRNDDGKRFLQIVTKLIGQLNKE